MKLFFLIAPLILARKYGGRDAGPQTPDREPRQKCDHTTRRLNGLIAATSCQKVCESKTDMKKCGLCSTLLQNSLMTGETHWPCYWKRLCELVCPKFVAAPDADAEFCQKLCKDDWHSVTLGNILSLSISYNTYAFPNKQHILTDISKWSFIQLALSTIAIWHWASFRSKWGELGPMKQLGIIVSFTTCPNSAYFVAHSFANRAKIWKQSWILNRLEHFFCVDTSKLNGKY